MERKYNLSLVPISKNDEIIAFAKQFSAMADNYMLGEKSLPHVTLYQFQAEEKEIGAIWKHVCNVWREKPIALKLRQISYITFDNRIFWISLLPDHRDILYKMHVNIANILQLPIKQSFDPHVTLVNSKNKKYEEEVALAMDAYQPMIDKFILSLGLSDGIGQLTEIIYYYNLVNHI